MTFHRDYLEQEPTRAEIDGTAGLTLLEFGTDNCGFCVAIQPAIAKVFDARADDDEPITHFKVADGSGRPLGRTFGIKLWPTLIALRDGVEVARAVRPMNATEVSALLVAPSA